MAEFPDGYPTEWETDALLRDGATVRVRPIRPDDADRMRRFHSRQSQESIYFRYFRYRPELSETEVTYFTTIDYEKRMAFIALIGDEMVAVSRYEGESATDGAAEVAFFVDDAHHGRGLATLMLEYLAERARERGITTFTASVLSENYRMLGVFKSAGFDVSTRFEDGAIAVTLGIGNPASAQEAIDAREQQARSKAVAKFFRPESVAVIGAGRNPGSVGHELLRSIIAADFNGAVSAVNPNAEEPILGVDTKPSIDQVEGPVDLAVIAIPADKVLTAVQRCIDADVKAVLVVSAGFSEEGSEGRERLAELVALVRSAGIRLVGPLSYGLVNTDPDVRLSAHFLDVQIPAGDVGLLSQSGPLGAAILNQFAQFDMGVSTFLSAGVRADVSVYDVLEYWSGDDATRTVALYLDNFGNPRNIGKIARRISRLKPVIAVEPPDPDLAALARAGGFVLVAQVSELVDQVRLMSSQPLPAGNSVVIVSNAGSVATLARGAAIKAGLNVVAPEEAVGAAAGPDGSVLVDDADTLTFTRSADAKAFETAVVAAAVSESVDAVLLALVPTPALPVNRLSQIVADVDRAVDKPVVAVNLVGEGRRLHRPPTFAYPEQAADALGRMAAYARWKRVHGEHVDLDSPDCSALEEAVDLLLAADDSVRLETYEPAAGPLLRALELPIEPTLLVTDEKSAADAAETLGYPVALKASWRSDRQAGEAGGTVLDIRHKQHLRRAFKRMGGSSEHPMIVQSMQGSGAHVRLHLRQDPGSGAHLFLGIGGLGRVDLPAIARLVLPAHPADIEALLTSDEVSVLTGSYPNEQLRSVIERMSEIAACVPDIAAIDLNPVLVSDLGATAVEARVHLRRWPVHPLAAVRTV